MKTAKQVNEYYEVITQKKLIKETYRVVMVILSQTPKNFKASLF